MAMSPKRRGASVSKAGLRAFAGYFTPKAEKYSTRTTAILTSDGESGVAALGRFALGATALGLIAWAYSLVPISRDLLIALIFGAVALAAQLAGTLGYIKTFATSIAFVLYTVAGVFALLATRDLADGSDADTGALVAGLFYLLIVGALWVQVFHLDAPAAAASRSNNFLGQYFS